MTITTATGKAMRSETRLNDIQEHSQARSNTDCGEIENQTCEILGLRQILRDEIKQYSELKPWISYLSILTQWVIIGCIIAVAVYFSNFFVWLLAAIAIAGRQHALMMLGHEASHYRISHNRAVNDFVGDVFCLLPLFLSLRRWGEEHRQHHRQPNTAKDPYMEDFAKYRQWHWPKSQFEAVKVFLKDLTLLNLTSNLDAGRRWSPFSKTPVTLTTPERVRAIVFVILLATTLTLVNGWWVFLTLWVLPLLTFNALFIRIRAIAEHLGIPDGENVKGIDATRHVDANWLERMTICPFGINYHIAHHIFPSVPCYNLKKFHQRLLKEPLYQKHARIKQGYFGRNSVFNEVLVEAS